MVFGFDNGAQTCNVFWSYIPLLCKAIEENGSFIIPVHERTIHDYPHLQECKWLKFPFYNKLFLGLFGEHRTRSLAIRVFNNSLISYKRLCKTCPNHFVNGYELRNCDVPDKAKSIIRGIFIPESSISRKVESQFLEIRRKCDFIIGIHIRRGDYRSWKNGRYYFEYQTYSLVCRLLLDRFSDKRVSFCLVSNEPVPQDVFEGIPYFQTPDKTPTQDLYALSLCDHIAGPPSSFSRFAAFRGNVPIAFIVSSDSLIFNFRRLEPA